MQKRERHPQKFMSSSQQKSVPRAVIEHMVREQVYQEMGIDLPAQAKAPKGFVVNISARHCHLTQEAVEALSARSRTHPQQMALSRRRLRCQRVRNLDRPTQPRHL